MTPRRYGDDEVREIFERASRETEVGGRTPATSDGLTLEELKRIGREVGLPAERIERAAASLERPDAIHPPRTFLGAPLSVSRMVPLDRPPSDREWEVLVADLRRTFRAKGTTDSLGSSRQWSNGNLHVSVEPGDVGYRLRLETLKGNARAVGMLGLGALLTGLVLLVVALLSGVPAADAVERSFSLVGLGALGMGANAIRLPLWARKRREQFEHIAERARRLTASDAEHEGPDPEKEAPGGV